MSCASSESATACLPRSEQATTASATESAMRERRSICGYSVMLDDTRGQRGEVPIGTRTRGPELRLWQLALESLAHASGDLLRRARWVVEEIVLAHVDRQHWALPKSRDPIRVSIVDLFPVRRVYVALLGPAA